MVPEKVLAPDVRVDAANPVALKVVLPAVRVLLTTLATRLQNAVAGPDNHEAWVIPAEVLKAEVLVKRHADADQALAAKLDLGKAVKVRAKPEGRVDPAPMGMAMVVVMVMVMVMDRVPAFLVAE